MYLALVSAQDDTEAGTAASSFGCAPSNLPASCKPRAVEASSWHSAATLLRDP